MTTLIISITILIFGIFSLEYIVNDKTPFQLLYRLYEFIFNRWTYSILSEGQDTIIKYDKTGRPRPSEYWNKLPYVLYKKVNKFDNSVKYEKKYLT